ncbi:patatin-like phospholipase family protein [Hoeflea sp. TYP-13]|uniref:patatin-like phospholipase family protein n=1 Tax=Hoeflea sp. TYP-13 TaxID=3230023 RepID=UPI0034C5F5A9
MKRFVRFCLSVLGVLVLAIALYSAVVYVYSRHLAEYDYRLTAWPPETDFEQPVEIKTREPRKARILAIEGGALFGLADLEVLKAIEEKSGKPVYELFDFFAGSSTGAIISTLLLHPDAQSGEPMSAEDAIKAYEDFAGRILDSPLYHRVLTGFGVLGPALTNEGRLETARNMVGDARFKDLLRPAMFPAYSQKTGGLKVFRNWNETEANIYLWSLVTAVTSVPSVFPAVVLMGDDAEEHFYGDPALISNEPDDLAYLHARTHLPDVDEFIVVSLGTVRDFSLTEETVIRGGLVEWFTPAFRLLYRGETNVSQGALERHAKFDSDVEVSLAVLSPVVPEGTSSFDASPRNIDLIRQAGRYYVQKNQKQINEVVKLLTNSGTKSGRVKAN